MFCPQCRQSWQVRSPQPSDPPPATPLQNLSRFFKKAKPRFRPCPVCHGPLVDDRLEQEFPPVAHASSKSDPPLSMAEILREIGPLGASALPGETDETRDWPGSRLDDDPHRLVPLGQRRFGMAQMSFDTFLGFGALAAIITVIVSLGVGVVWNETRTSTSRPLSATAVPAASHSVLRSDNGSVTTWPPAAILASLPETVSGGWHRWESDALLTQSDNFAATGQRMATYQRGTQLVHVWLQKAPESRDALTAFGGAARFVHTQATLLKRTPILVRLYGHDCLSFTDDLPATLPHYIEASHPFATAGNTLTWYRQGTLITVASEDQKARDEFASAYAPQH